jgi:serine-type D-Ala-D-Ala carboxypeptidase (penicillin-binding protein 5/6)
MRAIPAAFAMIVVMLTILCLGASNPALAQIKDKSDSKRFSRAHGVKTGKSKLHRVYKRKFRAVTPRAEAILLKDLTTGRIVFEQRANEQMPPASLTKIMSAIVILSEGNLDDSVVISRRAAAAKPTKMYLKRGTVFPLRGLLEAMLIRSANDACLAAAEHIAGTEEAFVVKMNAKAQELGLTQTQFRNACGFNMVQHYSTAGELATMTEYAMGYDVFSAIVKEPMTILRQVDQPKALVARNTNRLLGVMDGVVGVKTGYTRAAGRCLITVVRRGDKELLLVLLNSRQRWSTAQTLLEGELRDAPTILDSY